MLDFLESQRSNQKQRRAKKVRRIILGVFVIVVVGVGIGIVHAPVFTIDEIVVEGNKLLSQQGIIDSLQRSLEKRGFIKNLLFSDNSALLAMIEQSTLSQELQMDHPTIASAVVDVDPISGRMVVHIQERTQYGAWCSEQFVEPLRAEDDASSEEDVPAVTQERVLRCEWFDEQGIVFSEAPALEGALIHKVIDRSGMIPQQGDYVLDQEFIPHLREIFSFLEESGIGIHTLVLSDRSSAEIFSFHPDYPPLYFSLRHDPSYGLAGLEKIDQSLSELEYIDLRVKNRVYYK